jgi:peptidyl-prolyl cis-trans isomerase D
LITADKSQPAAERDKAKAKAQELLAVVQQSPDKFAEVARKNSQDPGSAAKGGDLDFFGRDAMTKPFADAAFALKKGEISGVVESEFGFHIIRLTDIKQPKQPSFDEQRAKLEKEVRRQLAQRKFAEAAEQFTNLVYEQSDSLQPVADRLKLEIQTAKGIGRDPVASATGPLASAKLLAAVFSSDATDKMRNTEAVEIGPNQLAAARVTHYNPARTLPLDEVKARVRELVLAEQTAKLAHDDGAAKLALWKANPEQSKLGEAVVISREKKQQQPNAVVEAALRASTQALPAWVGVDLGSDGYAVVRVEKVLPRDAAANDKLKRERDQYAQWWASAEGLAYYRLLKEKFKVEMKVARL